jgi:hypothetical protein
MKQLLLSGLLLVPIALFAQETPVHWQFSAQKISGETYAVHLAATVDGGWHVYSQIQPKEAVAQPTVIKFSSNPLIQLKGEVKEVGKRETYDNETIGIKQYQFSDKVDFVQTVTLKATVQTKVAGNLTYQVCTDKMCLPPATIPFSVTLQ